MLAAITFEFDPDLHLAGLDVRWETVGVAGAILLGLLAAAILVARTPPDALGRRLHLDDLLSLAIAAVPGGVVGGRLGYLLIHLDYYQGHASQLLDPGSGGLELTLAVLGGIAVAAYVARVLGLPAGAWAHVAAVPLLVAIGAGKAAMAWGGDGQGMPSTASWATAFAGPGPWGSLAPGLPSQPSQLYEAGLTLAAAVLLVVVLAAGGFKRRDGRLLLVATGLWLVGRIAIAASWRDATALGPLCADQVVSLAALAVLLVSLALVGRRPSRRSSDGKAPSWPDPSLVDSWRARAD